MNRINSMQLVSMLLIGDVFALFCTAGALSWMTAVGYIGAVLTEFAVMLPFALYYRRGGIPGKGIMLILLALVIIRGGLLLRFQWSAAERIYIPGESSGKLLTTGAVAVVCLYIASAGIKSLGRASVIAAAAGAVCVLIVVVYAAEHHNWSSLTLNNGDMTIGGEYLRGLRYGGGAAGGVVLLGLSGGNYLRNTAVYAAAKALAGTVLILTAVIILGGLMPIAEFPVVSAAQLSQPFPSQRTDSLFMIVFAVYAVYGTAVQAAAASHLLHSIFPDFSCFRSITAVSMMIAAAIAGSN